ncbi:Predicted orf (plasmid) [Photobacterium profundum SS9]|uniref:Predicted orf n=1 Tax=Photobacterium profundum (strain SS9) TaxID=298386 RepID=Q6LWA7_PHOPR|nr:Predicted orf [Photobacterium profundum SS9]
MPDGAFGVVFPVLTGLNRRLNQVGLFHQRVPRTHGAEPDGIYLTDSACYVFPVLTGLNRGEISEINGTTCVPRTHGAEPLNQAVALRSLMCSPYSRG